MLSPVHRRFLRGGIAAASLANLAMLGSWAILLDPLRSSINWGAPTLEATLAPVAVCLLAFVVGGALLLWWPRLPGALRLIIELLIIGCAVFVANGVRIVSGTMLPKVDAILTNHSMVWLAVAIAGAVAAFLFRKRIARGFMILLLVFSPYLALNMGRALLSALRTDYRSLNPVVSGIQQQSAQRGMRVVLIVFDELDYNFTYGDRPPDLPLPSFDRVRKESLHATAARSPGKGTQFSLPSLLTGKRVTKIVSRHVASLDVLGSGDSTPFDVTLEPTIFSDAFSVGARSELVGFFLPYCRWKLAAYLKKCTALPYTEGGVLDGKVGFGAAVMRQLRALALVGNRQAQIDRVKAATDAGRRAVSDSSVRLVLLHLPSPHMPPIWDRRAERFSLWKVRTSSYFDNLALTDRILSSLLAAVHSAGLDDNTVFVITSDHPWRLGAIDGRPPATTVPFLVRMPDKTDSEWTVPFETLRTRAMIKVLLSGQISTTPQLRDWISHDADSAVSGAAKTDRSDASRAGAFIEGRRRSRPTE